MKVRFEDEKKVSQLTQTKVVLVIEYNVFAII